MSINNEKSSKKPNGDNGGNAENSATATASAPAPVVTNHDSNEKVSDVLKKERLTRRITIETIAKDLKLNIDYLKALEEGDYANLPAAPYVRVYIKSLAKYLSLDAETLMKMYYVEQGLASDEKEANKIDITVQKQDKNPTAIIAAVLVVILAVFAFIANQRGWLSQQDAHQYTAPAVSAETVTNGTSEEQKYLADEDSVLAITNAPHDSGEVTKAPPRP